MVAVPTGCLVSPRLFFPQNIQYYTILYYITVTRKLPHKPYRAQGVSPTISLKLGANREGKERVKGKASGIQSSRIGAALVCVRRNVQHRELKLPESTRFELKTFRRTYTSSDTIRLLCIRLALPLTLSLPSRFMPSARLVVCAPPRALGLVGDFSCDCMFWDEKGGGLTPVGPQVDTATVRTVF